MMVKAMLEEREPMLGVHTSPWACAERACSVTGHGEPRPRSQSSITLPDSQPTWKAVGRIKKGGDSPKLWFPQTTPLLQAISTLLKNLQHVHP